MTGAPVPADFAAFVAANEHRLATTCLDLTGSARVAEALRRDLFAAVALRWRWWRFAPAGRRAGLASAHLARLVRREAVAWRSGVGWPTDTPAAPQARIRVVEDGATPTAGAVASEAWRRSRRLRSVRLGAAGAAIVALACVGALAPRVPEPPVRPPPPALPVGVSVLPTFDRLSTLEQVRLALPTRIDIDQSAPTLAEAPVSRAVAVLRRDLGPLVVLASDNTTRRIDPERVGFAQLLTTSLSPDGRRIALSTHDGLLVIDVTTGQLRPLTIAGQQGTPTLVWHSNRAALLPGNAGVVEVDVDTGATRAIPGPTAPDLVTAQGPTAPTSTAPPAPDTPRQLTELSPRAATVSYVARIRFWRAIPEDGTRVSRDDLDDRPIFGPPWIGDWLGPGWSTLDTFVRGCAPGLIFLPDRVGSTRAAIGAVGANGIYLGTLVAIDATALDVLGFADELTVLLAAGSVQGSTFILAWQPRTGLVQRVTMVNHFVRIALPDLVPSVP